MVKRYVELRNEHGLTPEESAHFKVYIDDYIPVHLHECKRLLSLFVKVEGVDNRNAYQTMNPNTFITEKINNE